MMRGGGGGRDGRVRAGRGREGDGKGSVCAMHSIGGARSNGLSWQRRKSMHTRHHRTSGARMPLLRSRSPPLSVRTVDELTPHIDARFDATLGCGLYARSRPSTNAFSCEPKAAAVARGRVGINERSQGEILHMRVHPCKGHGEARQPAHLHRGRFGS